MNPSRNETVKTRGTHPILRHLDYTPKCETTGGVVDETFLTNKMLLSVGYFKTLVWQYPKHHRNSKSLLKNYSHWNCSWNRKKILLSRSSDNGTIYSHWIILPYSSKKLDHFLTPEFPSNEIQLLSVLEM